MTTIDHQTSTTKGQCFFLSKKINDVGQNRSITTIDHHKLNTKGLLSDSLMINDMSQNRSYDNN